MSVDRPILALDISGSRTLFAVLDHAGQVLARQEVANRGGDAALAYWPAVEAATVALAGPWRPRAVGLSFGGPVGLDGRILSLHVGGWGDLDPAGALREALQVPVVIANDANCGAVGEHRYGAWGQPHTLVFLTCSTGIGGGLVADGRLLTGARGLGGELGHICIDPRGASCPCGARGCLEALCSGTAIARRATAALAATREATSLLADAVVGGVVPGAQPVFAAAARGDRLAREVLDAVFEDFGRGLAAIHNALDPSVIVVGGGVSLAGEALTRPVAACARPWVMRHRRDHLRFEAASLGLDSQLYGAAALAADAADAAG